MDSIKKIVYIVFLSLILLTHFSCVYCQNIPDTWEPSDSIETSECGNISGSYWNAGENTDQKDRLPSIFNYLLGNDKYCAGMGNIDYIVIAQKDQESIKVTAFSGDSVIQEITLYKSSGDFNCKNGIIKITNSKIVAEGPFVGIHHNTFNFTKPNNNNYILVKNVHTAFAPILIPIYIKDAKWQRFLEYTSSTTKKE